MGDLTLMSFEAGGVLEETLAYRQAITAVAAAPCVSYHVW